MGYERLSFLISAGVVGYLYLLDCTLVENIEVARFFKKNIAVEF